MSIVKTLELATARNVEHKSEKARLKYISETAIVYGNAKVKIHVAAVMALAWTAEEKDAKYIRAFNNAISGMKDEQDKLRAWALRATSFEHTKDDGTKETRSWLGYKEDKGGYFVKTGEVFTTAREGFRKDDAIDGERFYNKVATEKVDPDLEKFLQWAVKFADSASKKADKNGYVIPTDVADIVKQLSVTAKATLATVPAAGNA